MIECESGPVKVLEAPPGPNHKTRLGRDLMADSQPTRIENQCTISGCDLPHLANGMCKKHAQRVRRTGTPHRFCKKCDTQMSEDSGRATMCQICKESHVCAISGCNRPPQGRGWCKMHWKRWKSNGDPTKTRPSGGHNKKGPCLVSGCERKYHAQGYCKWHYYRFTRYGDPMAIGPGKHSGRYRAESLTYAGIHKRIFYDRGRATGYACVDCGRPAEEWSYDGGCPKEMREKVRGSVLAYSLNQSLYSARCKKCHRSKDLSVTENHYAKDAPTGVHVTIEEVSNELA